MNIYRREKNEMTVFSRMILHMSPENFYIEPKFDERTSITPREEQVMVINRQTEKVTCEYGTGWRKPGWKFMEIFGVLGTIRSISGPVLVVVTERSVVGLMEDQYIFKMDNAALIPYARSLTHLTEFQIRMDKEYMSMMMQVLTTPGMYFSYTYDLTHTVQRLHDFSPDFFEKPMYLRAEPRFLWNGHLLRELSQQIEMGGGAALPSAAATCARYLLPLMHGFLSIEYVQTVEEIMTVGQKMVSIALVSRRSVERAGTRLFTRGVDSDGRVANFVETEQIYGHGLVLSSFVQIRGSIPLFWNQLPNLKYKPTPTLCSWEPPDQQQTAFLRHLDQECVDYGGQLVCVSLIDQQGGEAQLANAFKQHMDAINRPVRYEAFDFHAECRKMRWDRLNILIDRLQSDIEEFAVDPVGTVLSQQYTVIRTNCIDCLDRTNVVQYMLARACFVASLKKHEIIGQDQDLMPEADSQLKNMWADNADMISIQYSGTGALKTDFTRTGKRTRQGVINDGINSITRYYKNNFCDGFRQDAIDLFLGHYKVSPDEGVLTKCPLEVERDWKYTAYPLILCVAFSMFAANVITPSEYTSGSLLWLMFWGSMCGFTIWMIMLYGHEFVDSPRLSAVHKVGHRSRSVAGPR